MENVDWPLVGIGLFVAALLGWFLGNMRRRKRRRDSLYRDDRGWYCWVDFDGTERSSRNNPDAAGGAWAPALDGSSGFDGGDSGGAGGD